MHRNCKACESEFSIYLWLYIERILRIFLLNTGSWNRGNSSQTCLVVLKVLLTSRRNSLQISLVYCKFWGNELEQLLPSSQNTSCLISIHVSNYMFIYTMRISYVMLYLPPPCSLRTHFIFVGRMPPSEDQAPRFQLAQWRLDLQPVVEKTKHVSLCQLRHVYFCENHQKTEGQ